MRASRILPLAMLLTAVLSGCADDDDSVRDVYGDDAQTVRDFANGTDVPDDVGDILLIQGSHLEGRFANGTWSANSTAAQTQTLTGPIMDAPAPSGGGGDATALPGVSLEASVRIPDGGRLEGYRAAWVVGEPEATGMDVDFDAVADADEEVSITVGFGTTEVYALLFKGEPEANATPEAIFMEPVRFTVTADFAITGEVQPFRPGGAGGLPDPGVTSREEMTDIYMMEVAAGTRVTATTAFNGMQGDGTDVDLGWFDPAGNGVQCVGGGGSTATVPLAPDPSQADESLEDVAASDGAWSIQVGAMQDGCSGLASWYYNNAQPVPYTLTIHLG